LKNDS